VNGQRLSSNTAAPPITTSANTVPILIERNDALDFFFKTSFLIHRKWMETVQSGTLSGLRKSAKVPPFEGLAMNRV
jgi:hypothetical protein